MVAVATMSISRKGVDVDNVVLAGVAGAWMLEALALGYVMGRRGYEAYSWTFHGTVLGLIAVAVALSFVFRPPSREPRLLHGGHRRGGPIDVLVDDITARVSAPPIRPAV